MTDARPNSLPWKEALDPRSWVSPSALFLLAVNLIPLFGVLFAGWDLFLLMMLYWMETGIIGFWHLLRLAAGAGWLSLFLVPFFSLHFGGFMAGHYTFLWLLFGKDYHSTVHNPAEFTSAIVLGSGLWLPLVALFVSHGFSLYLNAWKKTNSGEGGAFQKTVEGRALETVPPALRTLAANANDLRDIMTAPYKRIVVMHITIIFGAMLSMALGTNKAAFGLMVILKTLADVASHVRKHAAPVQT